MMQPADHREGDDVVEAVPPKGTDHALAVRILPRGPRRREDLLDSRRTHSTRNVAVGTTKKSMKTRSWLWFRRNERQVCDGGLRRTGMYRDTVACATSNPSMSNSP